MPTGYTAALYEGKPQTFEEFTMDCARAFGAYIEYRDSGLDEEVPDTFVVSEYHSKELEKAQTRLAELESLTDEQWEQRAEEEHQASLASFKAEVEKVNALRSRYETMLAQVRAWEPPTGEHQSLKDYMVNQLSESIRFDCSYPDAPKRYPIEEYRDIKFSAAQWSIDYHEKHWAKEQENVAGRNTWVKALRESLKV